LVNILILEIQIPVPSPASVQGVSRSSGLESLCLAGDLVEI
jgi:hypothetical protein